MVSYIVIGIGAGIASSVLFIAAASLFLLFLVAPLPMFIAGFGWGSISAGIAALSGSVVIGTLYGPAQGLIFGASIGLAPVILSHLAWRSRPATGGTDVEWYPMGRLVLWSAGIASVLVTVSILRGGPGAEAYFANMKAGFDEMLKLQPDLADTLNQAAAGQLDALMALFIRITPIIIAALWTFILIGNVWIGAKVVTVSGNSPRPWAPFPNLEFPRLASIALGVSLVAALLPGTIGLIAEALAAALVCAFTILGLGVIHYVTRNFPGRMLVLATAYLAIVMFNWLAALVFAAVGVAETGFSLRARKDAKDGGRPVV